MPLKCEYGFGNRKEPLPAVFAPHWEQKKARWKQVHGIACAEIVSASQDCGDVDALYSFVPGLPVAVVTADCVPILLARRDGRGVAAVHAGWRGTRAGILRALWERLAARGEKAGDWGAAIGPSIGPCCYEVSEELALDFEREFAAHGSRLAVPTHRRLDLPAINAAELRKIGLSQVEIVRACTRCLNDDKGEPIYHSYRREGGGTRQYSVISPAHL